MRLINFKLLPDTRKSLEDLAASYGKSADMDWIEDLYALMVARGSLSQIPNDQEIETKVAALALKEKWASVKSSLVRWAYLKRASALRTACGKTFMAAAVAFYDDPLKGLSVYLLLLLELSCKRRENLCADCKLLAACSFGTQFSAILAKSVDKLVLFEDSAKLTHPDCPNKPTAALDKDVWLDQNNRLLDEMLLQLESYANSPDYGLLEEVVLSEEESDMKQLSGSGASAFGRLRMAANASFTAMENFVKELTKQQWAIFDLGKELAHALGKAPTILLEKTIEVAEDSEQNFISSASDLPKMLSSQLALPKELVEHKFASKSLVVEQQMKPEQKQKLLYILLDTSASMGSPLAAGGSLSWLNLLNRSQFARILIKALLHRCEEVETLVYLRTFDSRVSEMAYAKKKGEYELLRKQITYTAFNGCSTFLGLAMIAAAKDILEATDDLTYAELLVLTDCEAVIPDKEKLQIHNALSVAAQAGNQMKKGFDFCLVNLDSVKHKKDSLQWLKEKAKSHFTISSNITKVEEILVVVK